MALVLLRVRDDQAEVRVRHPLLGSHVAALDLLRECDLLGGGQERVAPHLVEEELQGVGRSAGTRGEVELGLVGHRVVLVTFDLDVGLLERSAKRGEGLLVEVVLGVQGVDLRRSDEAALLRIVDESGYSRVCFEGIVAQGKFSQHHVLRLSLGLARARGTAAGAPIYRY